MTPDILIAAIGAFATLGAAGIAAFVSLGRRLDKVHDKTEVVRDQVQNSHGTNLRDDLDAIRGEMREGFKAVAERQDAAAATVNAVRKGVGQSVADLTRRLDNHIDGGNA